MELPLALPFVLPLALPWGLRMRCRPQKIARQQTDKMVPPNFPHSILCSIHE